MLESRLSHSTAQKALQQAINNKAFKRHNTHLTAAELFDLSRSPPKFPERKPVFSPYARTKAKGSYSQVRIDTFGKRKVYIHRVAAVWKHGAPARDDYEASHTLGGYQGCERDFNPNNLVWESGRVNKTRWFCMDLYAKLTEQGKTHEEAIVQVRTNCSLLHLPHECQFKDPSWALSEATKEQVKTETSSGNRV